MSLKHAAEEYFRSMNSIASRLYEDMEDTKSSYEELWNTLSEKEQQIIITESIIKPEISIKYSSEKETTDKPKFSTEMKINVPKQKPKVPQKTIIYKEPVFENTDKPPESDSMNSLPKTGLDFLDNW
ncbi:hypothetical protein JTB14_003430 [Gonioctena quinquepunctata]|nr:hypothetical protein JTB14_003430 [Gonioctena quinquepunctata]